MIRYTEYERAMLVNTITETVIHSVPVDDAYELEELRKDIEARIAKGRK